MGFRTVAIARGQEKEPLARKLGADHYIDGTDGDVAKQLQALGGAKVVLATVTDAGTMSATIDGLGRRGELVIVGVAGEPLKVGGRQLLNGDRKIYAHSSGAALDTRDTLSFAARTGVRAWTEVVPLEDMATALEKMTSGKARFRMVLTTSR
ncbi:zinc-binding dehydrogenase [Streptomyces sp. NPDC012756]|uniref:zinc-binding dehydrogenase n=1 Tax=Streptomyces sp. NPDC012756 TaxID=3364847 RepID=UPI0036951857